MLKVDAEKLFENIKAGKAKYDQDKHCLLILQIMSDPFRGRHSAFCAEAGICETKFYTWLRENDLFMQCYALGKIIARENWELEGLQIRDMKTTIGVANYRFEHWRMIGWSRYGIGKTSRIRLNLDPDSTPDKHYAQLLKQAGDGEFTSGEIKQLMEAINVGLNTHQVFKLQQEIDQLKSDLKTMAENSNGNNPVTN